MQENRTTLQNTKYKNNGINIIINVCNVHSKVNQLLNIFVIPLTI